MSSERESGSMASAHRRLVQALLDQGDFVSLATAVTQSPVTLRQGFSLLHASADGQAFLLSDAGQRVVHAVDYALEERLPIVYWCRWNSPPAYLGPDEARRCVAEDLDELCARVIAVGNWVLTGKIMALLPAGSTEHAVFRRTTISFARRHSQENGSRAQFAAQYLARWQQGYNDDQRAWWLQERTLDGAAAFGEPWNTNTIGEHNGGASLTYRSLEDRWWHEEHIAYRDRPNTATSSTTDRAHSILLSTSFRHSVQKAWGVGITPSIEYISTKFTGRPALNDTSYWTNRLLAEARLEVAGVLGIGTQASRVRVEAVAGAGPLFDWEYRASVAHPLGALAQFNGSLSVKVGPLLLDSFSEARREWSGSRLLRVTDEVSFAARILLGTDRLRFGPSCSISTRGNSGDVRRWRNSSAAIGLALYHYYQQ